MDALSLAGIVQVLLSLTSKMLDISQQLEYTRRSAKATKSLKAEVGALYDVLRSIQPLVFGNETEVSIIPTSLLNTTMETLDAIMEVICKHRIGFMATVAGIL